MAYTDWGYGIESPAVSLYKLVTDDANPQGYGDR
jgi:hypothetical protein